MTIVGLVLFAAGTIGALFCLRRALRGDVSMMLAMGFGAIVGIVGGFMVSHFLVLALLAVITVVAAKAKSPDGERPSWTRPLAGIAGTLGLLLAIGSLFYTWLDPAAKQLVQAAQDHNSAYRMAKVRVAGEFVAERYAGERAIVVTPPQFGDALAPDVRAEVDAFLDELGSQVTVAATVPVGVFAAAGGMVMDSGLTAARLNEIILANPEAKLIICLTPFPSDYEELIIWPTAEIVGDAATKKTPSADIDPAGYRIFMVDGFPGQRGSPMEVPSPVNLVPYVDQGLVCGIVVERADFVWNADTKLPSGDQARFDARYIMLQEFNLQSILSEHPEWRPADMD